MHAKKLLALAITLVIASVIQAETAAPPDRIYSISGHGMWALDTGDVYENHQPYIESTMINAWLDSDNSAHGTIVWMDTYNGPADDHGGLLGWQVDVDTFP
jgi:hypothetical protein